MSEEFKVGTSVWEPSRELRVGGFPEGPRVGDVPAGTRPGKNYSILVYSGRGGKPVAAMNELMRSIMASEGGQRR